MIETWTTLTCDRETRPPVAGMRTICGRPYQVRGKAEDAVHLARAEGWTYTRDRRVYCPDHRVEQAGQETAA